MKDTNEIMKMLDWNNSAEVQIAGISIGKECHDFSVFIQPSFGKFDKNVWDNCALIIASKSDEQLEPFSLQLFEWVEDLNWPGALTILERLKRFSAKQYFVSTLETVVKNAYINNGYDWIGYLSELLINEEIKAHLTQTTISLLEEYHEYGYEK